MKTKILNSMKTTGLVLAGMATAVVLNINIAYASVAEMLDPVLLMIESELLIIGKRLCVAAIIGCGIKYAFANDQQSAKTGKPQVTKEDIPQIFYRHYPDYKSKQLNISEFARICNLSRTTVYKYISLLES